ncbi:hypothetical protein [Streptomyces europaeiscabiei]|uniref:hypothetical protein n=1 Tax=Streptomyces europaeiscabiei TaxID=146819 RepID=UPI000A834A90|nr:hypothetical protein [Streptomyces europaeiscabiei]
MASGPPHAGPGRPPVKDHGRWDIDVTRMVSVEGGVPFTGFTGFTEERWEEFGFESRVYV